MALAVQIEWVLFTNTGEDVLANRLMQSDIPPVFLLTPFKSEMRPLQGFWLSVETDEQHIEAILNEVESVRRRLLKEGLKLHAQGIKILTPCEEFRPQLLKQSGYKDIPPFQDAFIKYEKHFNVGITRLGSYVQIQIRPKAPGLSVVTPTHHIVTQLLNVLNGKVIEQITMEV